MVVVSNDPFGSGQPELFKGNTEDTSKSETKFCTDIASPLPSDALIQKSPKKIIELLAQGVKEQNIAIVKQCIYHLDQQLNQSNVLTIFSSLSKYTTFTNNNYEPSAPPLEENTGWLQDLIQNLRNSCLLKIDRHADFVLKQVEILQLNYNDLLSIVERDTLQVSNEGIVYVTIYKWAVDECHRRHLDENDLSNLKKVLQRIQHSPRYGLMSKHKFTTKIVEGVPGPTRSGILDEKDWRLIKFYIDDKAKNRPVKDLPHKWSKPRILCRNNSKKLNSTCSSPIVVGQNKTACERCLINFLSCWTAVFD